MIIVKLQGGLGNQMFQYALGKIIELKYESHLLLDVEFYNDQIKKKGFTPRQFALQVFDCDIKKVNPEIIQSFLSPSIINQLKRHFNMPHNKIYFENTPLFDKDLFLLTPPLYISGYFQSEKYFLNHQSFVRDLFKFPHNAFLDNKHILNDFKLNNSVSVHFRRGDYIADEVTNKFHGICSLDYYLKAFELICSKLSSPKFYIFSDDIEWVEKSISHWKYNVEFIKTQTLDTWIDMFLMSQCRHNIIANSSYSWWSAWLNNNDDKIVIAPQKWFNHQDYLIEDIIPEMWIKL